jgi:hypothetical protein
MLLAFTITGLSAAAVTSATAAATGNSIPWTSLGVVRPSLVQPSGWGSPIAAQPSSSTYAWCSREGVEIVASDGKSNLVSDSSVVPMLRASHFLLRNWNTRVGASCVDVALDPSHPKTVYAGFNASQGGSIPPLYNVALVTSNLGRSWRFVPPPRGYSLTDFAGFVEQPRDVEMLYTRIYFFPMKPGQSASFVAATSSTGGQSWNDVHLNCSVGATCLNFGPQAPQGACAMSEWQQSVLVNSPGENDSTTRWREAGAVPSVSQCGDQQLIATTSRDEFLIDRSRANALLYTHDGVHWTTVLLPKIDGRPVGGRIEYLSQAMTLASDGALIAVTGTPTATVETLEVLQPGAKTWCPASATLPAATKKNPVSAIQSSDSRLVVAFFTPIRTGQGKEVSALTFPLSALRCRT